MREQRTGLLRDQGQRETELQNEFKQHQVNQLELESSDRLNISSVTSQQHCVVLLGSMV